jgi:hypothetical protein
MDEQGRCSGRCKSCCNLAGDVTALAHAGKNHSAARAANEVEGLNESLPERTLERIDEHFKPFVLDAQRASGTCNQSGRILGGAL